MRIRRPLTVSLLAALAVLVPLTGAPAQENPPRAAEKAGEPDAVVRVNVTAQPYDFIRPWSKKAPSTRSAIGAIIEGSQVLVTAELVADHTYIELENPTTAAKSPASLVAVDYSANLALLKPADPDFLVSFRALQLADGAGVGDHLEAWQLEATGTLLRTDALLTSVQVAPYPMGDVALLVYQLTSALQSRDGSFTIPLVQDGKLAGVVMRFDARTQNVGAIPADVIRHFLKDAADGEYVGFPLAGVSFTATRDPQFRKFIGLDPNNGGVYVDQVVPNQPAAMAGLLEGDVILSVSGHKIDQDGNYLDSRYGKISLSHLISVGAYAGDPVAFEVFRGGKKLTINVPVRQRLPEDYVSLPYVIDEGPRFLVVGGLIFEELSRQYLREWGNQWEETADRKLVYYDKFQTTLFEGEKRKLVFLSQILPTPSSIGYKDLDQLVVTKFNNVEIKCLDDLKAALEKPVDGAHRIEFEDDPKVLFLDPAEAAETNRALKQVYGLPALERME